MFRIAKFTASPIVPVALTLGVFAITACGDQAAQEEPAITLEEEAIVTQCETFNTSDYNADGSCFDAQPRPKAATLVPLTPQIVGRPSPATLAVKVNADGTVALILPIANSDNAAFTQAALVFAMSIEYNPAHKDGQAVVGWTQQVFFPGRRQ